MTKKWIAAAALLLAGISSPALAREVCPTPAKGEDRPWLNPHYSPECRARFVLASLGTLEAKLKVLTAGFGASNDWLTSRGLPVLRGTDGPAGVRGPLGVTAFPTPLGIAASFDPQVATRYGDLMGKEFFAAGFNQMGGPALDLARTWHFGRLTESLGEDPYLDSIIAPAEIRGVQANHVINMAKHFAVYTQEQGRAGDAPTGFGAAVDNIISERAIREIYLPGFEAAIRQGGAGQVMCSFPRINHVYACENPLTLGILKREWGFDGMVVPDFPDAQRSIVAAVNAGLDSGIFKGQTEAEAKAAGTPLRFGGEDLAKAVADGKVSPARVDDLILRRLVAEFRIGTFDHPATAVAGDVSTPETRAALAELVAAGSVLLKNKGAILPLGPGVKSIALIGAQAGGDPQVVEMGSAYVTPSHVAPVLPALCARAGEGVRVDYAPGTLGLRRLPPAPTSLFRTRDGRAGWQADYVANPALDFAPKPFATRMEESIDLSALPRLANLPADKKWSVRWTSQFVPLETGVQKFTLYGGGTAKLIIGGKLVGRFDNVDFGDTLYANVPMIAGQPVDMEVDWSPRSTFRDQGADNYGTSVGPQLRLGWARPDDLIAQAAEAARKADVAIVLAGHRVGEGMDRDTLALQNDQDALIAAVAAANPRTIVVLQTGGPVTMPWLDQVAGVLEMWLPGDVIGPASAKLLFGDSDPGGRLPVTFPRDERQGPAAEPSHYPGTLDPTGAVDTAHYDEGLLIGYRWYDAKGQAPLFPFGYGLSYARIDAHLTAIRAAGGGARVEVDLVNRGARSGTQVVQVYVGHPAADGEPPRQLRAVQKLALAPGEQRHATLTLPHDAFRHWDEAAKAWKVTPGRYEIFVGTSSRDAIGSGAVNIR